MTVPKPDHYRVNLHILSPIHIGTGQEFDPFSYIIRGNTLFLIDLIQWMENYSDPEALHKMTDSDNFANIRSFIASRFDMESAIRCAIPIDNPKLIRTYHRVIQEKNPRNQVLISPMMRNEISMEAYIPGSSVKGAMRTAITNHFVAKARVTKNDARGRMDYNQKIFGRIQDDPMRYLKLADVPLGKSGTVIVEAAEYPLRSGKPLTPKNHMETSFSLCHARKPFVYPFRLSLAPFKIHGTKIDLKFVIDALYRFYVSKYRDEYVKFFQSGDAERTRKVRQEIIPMNKAIAGLRSNETLIRIGHFSHVECITLDKVRNPRTRLGRDRKPLPWGTTRTLANGTYPYGWAKLEFPDLKASPRATVNWPFLLEGGETGARVFDTNFSAWAPGAFSAKAFGGKPSRMKPVKSVPRVERTPFQKLMDEVNVIKPGDMGRIGNIVSQIESLGSDAEKGKLAKAIKSKMSAKQFKKYNKKALLLDLIAKAD